MSLRAGLLDEITSEEEAEAAIIEVVRTIIERDEGLKGRSARTESDLETALKSIVEAVVDLLESRLRSYHRPDSTMDEMKQIRDVRHLSIASESVSLMTSDSLSLACPRSMLQPRLSIFPLPSPVDPLPLNSFSPRTLSINVVFIVTASRACEERLRSRIWLYRSP